MGLCPLPWNSVHLILTQMTTFSSRVSMSDPCSVTQLGQVTSMRLSERKRNFKLELSWNSEIVRPWSELGHWRGQTAPTLANRQKKPPLVAPHLQAPELQPAKGLPNTPGLSNPFILKVLHAKVRQGRVGEVLRCSGVASSQLQEWWFGGLAPHQREMFFASL